MSPSTLRLLATIYEIWIIRHVDVPVEVEGAEPMLMVHSC